ncbi:MAG: DUF4286 family protein [Chitinophagia bacterium]|nr:DUF4286 family protein [Chitinophagia bacterium]
MIVYNVTVKVNNDTAEQWEAWMRQEHIPQILSLNLFNHATLSRLLEQDEADGITYIAQYHCNTLNQYNQYINEHAPKMRAEGVAKFPNRFTAFRTVMEVIYP